MKPPPVDCYWLRRVVRVQAANREPAPRKSLLAVLETLDPLDETFPEIADPPPEDVDL